MKRARLVPVLLSIAGLVAAGSASAQMVPLSRCRSAYPCSFPFGLQYAPDPLIAGPYAQVPNTAVSGRIELKAPIRFELNRPVDQNAIDEAVRKSIEIHNPAEAPPAPSKGTAPAGKFEPKPVTPKS